MLDSSDLTIILSTVEGQTGWHWNGGGGRYRIIEKEDEERDI